MTSGNKKVHEKYHNKTSAQLMIISGKNFTYRHLIKYITKYLRKNDSILDIGCGVGTLDFYFASKGYMVTGIDIAENAISACNKTKKHLKLKNVNFIVDDFQKTKLKVKYDFIIFTEVIEHLENDDKQLKKIYSLLKPGGFLFLSTPSTNAPMYRLGLAEDFDKRVGHLRRYTKNQIVNLVSSNNFEIIEVIENEGILRNFLYINNQAGKLIRFLKYFISEIVTFLDKISQKLFGESNYFVIAKKE